MSREFEVGQVWSVTLADGKTYGLRCAIQWLGGMEFSWVKDSRLSIILSDADLQDPVFNWTLIEDVP